MTEGASAAPEVETPLGGPDGPCPLPEPAPTPFALFGLPVTYTLDADDLRRRLVRISRWLHPDFFAADEALRTLAERNTSELNVAHEVLADDRARADWLVGHLGGPDEKTERQMPTAFLMEVLEWNETLEAAADAAPGSPERGALDALEPELRAQRAACLAAISALLDPLPPQGDATLARVREHLNAVRYVDRALGTVQRLRLDQASAD